MLHTPGPWEDRPSGGGSHEIYAPVSIGRDDHGAVLQPIYEVHLRPELRVGEDGVVSALVTYESWRQFPSVDFKKMQDANARLITAAPELLEAAREALNHLTWVDVDVPVAEKVRAAIAKAEGGAT